MDGLIQLIPSPLDPRIFSTHPTLSCKVLARCKLLHRSTSFDLILKSDPHNSMESNPSETKFLPNR